MSIADAFLQQILTRPAEYDVIATPNLNGDYISDALAAQVGGIGIAPGANINYVSGHAVFEATQALDLMTRCISFGTTVPMLPTAYNNNYQIVQSGKAVAIDTEMVHQVRRIPTDGSTAFARTTSGSGTATRAVTGKATRWSWTRPTSRRSERMTRADENLQLVERFTRVAPESCSTKFTVDDRHAWTQPWSVR